MKILDELKSWINLEMKESEKNKRDSSGNENEFYHRYNVGRAFALRAVLNKIDVLLEKPATADGDKIASQRYALVNTVDSISKFLERGVYLFDSQEIASEFAVKTIREHCSDVVTRATNAGDSVIELFQDGLESIEYFQIERVIA